MIGAKLGTYEITAAIGQGGMGEVYRARDTKLGRDVAIKVLPEAFSQDPERLARFQREAQLLASLNHPNIATLHGLEEHDATHYLVMELVEGETLAERLSRGALSVDEARSIASVIAEALEDAHEKGIVHRDLKPANVKITPEGRVKVLDFGLAKAFGDETEVTDSSLSPTITRDATKAGVILGTAAYMSPEQARGKPVDKRSDIFSFGSVLYEMLTGQRAFEGEMVSDVLASVIKTEPRWDHLPAEMAPLLKRCMDKNPRERFRDIGDVRYELARKPEPGVVPTGRPRWPWAVAVAAAFVLGMTLAGRDDVPETAPLVQTTILPPAGEQFAGGFGLALSPDGTRLAFTDNRASERRRIWIRPLDALEATPLERTEGARFPFWSPDGRALGFFADDQLKIVSASGGTPRMVASAPNAAGGAWNESGVIVFASDPDGLLYRVDAQGGETKPATDLGARARSPAFLPDGRHFLFHAFVPNTTVMLGDVDTGKTREVIPNAFGAAFAHPRWILFMPMRSTALFAQTVDTETLAPLGEPVSLIDDVWEPGGYASYSVSADGRLAYEPRPESGELKRWMDRSGAVQSSDPVPEDATGWSFRLSPTGEQLAVAGFGIGVVDLARGVFQRLPTPWETVQLHPTWSPDASRIAYRTTTLPDRRREIRIAAADGSSDESLVQWEAGEIHSLDWSPGGKTLIVAATDPQSEGTQLRLWLVGVDDSSSAIWLEGSRNVSEPRFSPDGSWVAYRSDETGLSEVYVRPFPGPGSSVRVSTAGGANPSWRGDGRELFYVALDGRLTAVDVDADADETLRLSPPRPLFDVRRPGEESSRYTVTPDGQRFLVRDPSAAPLTLVQGWHQLLP